MLDKKPELEIIVVLAEFVSENESQESGGATSRSMLTKCSVKGLNKDRRRLGGLLVEMVIIL